jgi:hypothetical protein
MFEMTPSVIDVRSCVPFEPQKLEFSSTCQNFIELPRCQLESHTQSVFNGPIKKSQGFKSGERAGDKTGQLRPIEEAIDKMQLDVVDLLILSVERVEDDTDVMTAFTKVRGQGTWRLGNLFMYLHTNAWLHQYLMKLPCR